MARLARVVVPSSPHHIIQRGNRRQHVFFSDNDKDIYLDLLYRYTTENKISVWAYTLMDNHVHIVAVPSDCHSLARGIGETNRRYSRMVNFREGWRGYLWQGRYISYPMDERHLYTAIRYIELNPVRAKIVANAEDYKWSSARAHVLGVEDRLLSDNDFLLDNIGNWKAFLQFGDNENDLKLFRKHARTGRPLGDESFLVKLENLTGRLLRKQKPGRRSSN